MKFENLSGKNPMLGIVLFLCSILSLTANAGTFEANHVGFNQAVVVHGRVINYSVFSPPPIERAPSIMRAKVMKPAPAVSGWQKEIDADAAWRNYYRKIRGRGIASTTVGSVLLAGGLAAVIYATFDYTIGFNVPSRDYTAVVNGNNVQWANQIVQTRQPGGGIQSLNYVSGVGPTFLTDVMLMSFGGAAVITGLVLTPHGSHLLKIARKVKQNAKDHDVIVSAFPLINPVNNTYACNLTFKF